MTLIDNAVQPVSYSTDDIRVLFDSPDVDGLYQGESADHLRTISRRRPTLILAFPPKSAGSFLRNAAVLAVNGALVRSVTAQGGREDQFRLQTFVEYYSGGICAGPMVTHVHMQARLANRHLINMLSLKPAVMIRSIPDMLASTWDMLMNEPIELQRCIICPLPEDFADFSDAHKADMLIDLLGPWYVSNYASWISYAADQPQTVLLPKYRDFVADPTSVLGRILQHAGMPRPREVCQAALEYSWQGRNDMRFNKGVSGRGRTYFSQAHFDRLAAMIQLYPVLADWQDEIL
ncbi:MAG: hypothetical protein WCD42_11530 [Rhizomicrobium sp.]